MDAMDDFGFMSDALLYTSFFQPATDSQANNLCEWACTLHSFGLPQIYRLITYVNAHDIVKESGVFNYMGPRIRVPTELNISNWRSVCGITVTS